eukprot:scaffold134679_cov27-Tisochrysis_lutea.AAC.5
MMLGRGSIAHCDAFGLRCRVYVGAVANVGNLANAIIRPGVCRANAAAPVPRQNSLSSPSLTKRS